MLLGLSNLMYVCFQVKKKKFKLDKDNGPSSPDRMLTVPHITYDHVAEDRKPDFSFEAYENSGKKFHYKMPVTVMASISDLHTGSP